LFGVDHFFLLQDVCSPIDTVMAERILENYIKRGDVTLYNSRVLFPSTVGHDHTTRQSPFYNYVFKYVKDGSQFDWLACGDVDEFIVPCVDETIPDFLARFNVDAVAGIVLRQMAFGCGNTEDIPTFTPASVIETCRSFLHKPQAVKSISSVKGADEVDVHYPVGDNPLINSLGEFYRCKPEYTEYRIAFYAHYIQPSLEILGNTFRNTYFPYNNYNPEWRKSRCNTVMNRFRNNDWVNHPEGGCQPDRTKFDPNITTNLVKDIYEKRKAGF
jgi:hypothetical protein